MFYFVQDALQNVKKEISKMVQKRLNITFCTQNAAQSVFPQVYSRIYKEPVAVAGAYEKWLCAIENRSKVSRKSAGGFLI